MYPCVPRPSHTQGVTSVNLWGLALFGEGIPGAECLERGLGRRRGGWVEGGTPGGHGPLALRLLTL